MALSDLAMHQAKRAHAKARKWIDRYEDSMTDYARNAAREYVQSKLKNHDVVVSSGMGAVTVLVKKKYGSGQYDPFDLKKFGLYPDFLKVIDDMDGEFGKLYDYAPSPNNFYLRYVNGVLVEETK